MSCLSGCLVSSASVQKLFCGSAQHSDDLLMNLWERKVSLSYSSAILGCSHILKNFPQFVVIHTAKGFGIVNKTEVDVFLELSCFFDDLAFK